MGCTQECKRTGGTLENYTHKLDVLRQHCDAVDRDYDEIRKTWACEQVAVAATEEEARRMAAASPFSGNNLLVRAFAGTETLQNYLNLFTLWHNMRVYQRSKRQGSSPYQIAGIPTASDDWLELLGYPAAWPRRSVAHSTVKVLDSLSEPCRYLRMKNKEGVEPIAALPLLYSSFFLLTDRPVNYPRARGPSGASY
jgi:hypothetical protein